MWKLTVSDSSFFLNPLFILRLILNFAHFRIVIFVDILSGKIERSEYNISHKPTFSLSAYPWMSL